MKPTIVFLWQSFHQYKFNWKNSDTWGIDALEGPYLASTEIFLNSLVSPSKIRRLFRSENRQTLFDIAMNYNIVIWRSQGWHLSSFYPPSVLSMYRVMSSNLKNDSKYQWPNFVYESLQNVGYPYYKLEFVKSAADIAESIMSYSLIDSSSDIPIAAKTNQNLLEKYIIGKSTNEQSKMMVDALFNFITTSSSKSLNGNSPDNIFAIQYHSSSVEKNHKYIITCNDQRKADRHQIKQAICCTECLLQDNAVLCEYILEYADTRCQQSSNRMVELSIGI